MSMTEDVDRPGVNPDHVPQRTRAADRATRHALRKRQVLVMRQAGHTFDEIGQAVGISQQHASKLFRAAVLDTYRQPAEEERALELLRTDGLVKRWWPKLLDTDDAVAERASNQLRWILTLRADLLGIRRQSLEVSGVVGVLDLPSDAVIWNQLQEFRRQAMATDQGEAIDAEARPAIGQHGPDAGAPPGQPIAANGQVNGTNGHGPT